MIDVSLLVDGARNDTGVAARVLLAFPESFRYRPGIGWMRWRETHWHQDRTGAVVEYISATIDLMIAAADLLDPEPAEKGKASPRAEWLRWCRSLGDTRSLYAIERRLQTWPGVVVVDGWDANPYLINTPGGVVDLCTGAVEPHNPRHLLTRCTGGRKVEVAPHLPGDGAPGSRWDAFLSQVLPDPETRAYLQRFVGKSLIGKQIDHHVAMVTGTGGNGKGSMIRACATALADYFSTLPASFFVETQQTPHPTEIADLAGRRMCVSCEIPAGKRFDETRLKEITGGDKLKARYMGKDFFEFVPSHTVWITCNEKPRITSTDNSVWRRVRTIPFKITIPADQIDRGLDDALAAESDLVFTWALEGARAYLSDGLGTCPEVEAETADYRQSQDTLAQAIAEVCDVGPLLSEPAHDLHRALCRWYSDMGLTNAPNQIVLGRELARRGFGRKATATARLWQGLRVRDDWRQPEPAKWQQSGRRDWHD